MKIHVASVGYSSVEVGHVMSVMRLRECGVSVQIHAKHALWEVARSQVASLFLRNTDADVLLMVEADVSFDSASAVALCEEALKHDIVAAVCSDNPRDHCW